MEQLNLITHWMTCLASGLSALHAINVKHQDIKPKNILLDGNILPVICDFGLSSVLEKDSKSDKMHGTLAYLPPESFNSRVGRKGDVFSLGLTFLEIALLFFGQKSLKEEISGPFYAVITDNLEQFLRDKLPLGRSPKMDEWNKRFRELITNMLDPNPETRLKASAVWQKLKGMVEFLGQKHLCNAVSDVGSIASEFDDKEDDAEVQLREDKSTIEV
jgi:serine/threonine protein kinase